MRLLTNAILIPVSYAHVSRRMLQGRIFAANMGACCELQHSPTHARSLNGYLRWELRNATSASAKCTNVTAIESTTIQIEKLGYWREIPTQRTHNAPPTILCIAMDICSRRRSELPATC